MSSRLILGLAAAAVAILVLPATAASGKAQAGTLTLIDAKDLGPSLHGEASGVHGWIPLHAREYGQAKAAANRRGGVGGKRPGGGGGSGGTAPVVSGYANVSPSFNGIFQTGVTPPDSTGAIGPDRYIETVNQMFAIYTRGGSLVRSGSLATLTGISGGFFGYSLSDPQMMWDAKTQRFYYSAVYFDSLLFDNGIAIGWSKTASPASASDFCKYSISFGSELPDYPKLGDSSDFLLVGYNLFGLFGSSYDGSRFVTLNKPPAGSLSCAPASGFRVTESPTLQNADSSSAATPVPANLVDDSNGAGYVVADADLSTTPAADFASVYTVTTAGVSGGIPVPAIAGPTNVTVPVYSMPTNAAQKGSSYLLDTLDGRFEAAVAATDPGSGMAVWTAHAVFGGAGVEERWYEIDPNAGSLVQSGVVSSPSLFVWNGAVSPDRANNGVGAAFGDSMAMSVSTSSPSDYPAIQVVWKKAGSAQSGPVPLVQATGPAVDFSCSQGPSCRWGDYSGASPDPAGAGTTGRVWIANQYNLGGGSASSTSWRTWVAGVTPT